MFREGGASLIYTFSFRKAMISINCIERDWEKLRSFLATLFPAPHAYVKNELTINNEQNR